jgi:hypothetical protein
MRPEDQFRREVDDTLGSLPAGVLTGGYVGEERDGDPGEWLLMRRVAEERAGVFSAGEYREAASALRVLGSEDEAQVLAALAGTEPGLAKADAEWRERYRDWAPTLAERNDRLLLASGRARQHDSGMVAGMDGVVYTPAEMSGPAGVVIPAVVAATHAGTVEVITGFRSGREQREWLEGRRYQRFGAGDYAAPLAACVTGPRCRVALEEQVLAGLFRHGDPGGDIVPQLSPTAFSTHARFETYMALLTADLGGPPDVERVREKLAGRLLRAPEWAIGYVGRPAGHLTLVYADRLAATPVSRGELNAAAGELVRDIGLAVAGRPAETGRQRSSLDRGSADHQQGRRVLRSRPVRVPVLPYPSPGGQPPETPSPGVVPGR